MTHCLPQQRMTLAYHKIEGHSILKSQPHAIITFKSTIHLHIQLEKITTKDESFLFHHKNKRRQQKKK